MTAINVILLPGVAHVFADGGHFDGKILRHIQPKVYKIQGLNAVMAWSGPTFDAEHVLATIDRCRALDLSSLIEKLPLEISILGWEHPFSAIVVGTESGNVMGVAIEEAGKAHRLKVGSVVRSMSSPIAFDTNDLVRSAVEMMVDQRARHGRVGGFIEHVEIRDDVKSSIVKTWPDLVVGGTSLMRAAKIADLAVDTINFAPQSITGFVTRTTDGALTIPNANSFPPTILANVPYSYMGNQSSSTAALSVTVVRTRDSFVVCSTSGQRHTGSGTAQGTLNVVVVDYDPQPNDTYTFTVSQSSANGGSAVATSRIFSVFYTKR